MTIVIDTAIRTFLDVCEPGMSVAVGEDDVAWDRFAELVDAAEVDGDVVVEDAVLD